jgi:hypothetical protein
MAKKRKISPVQSAYNLGRGVLRGGIGGAVGKAITVPGDLYKAFQRTKPAKFERIRPTTIKGFIGQDIIGPVVSKLPAGGKLGEIKGRIAGELAKRGLSGSKSWRAKEKKHPAKYKKGGKLWIAKAIKKPGVLHRQLGVKKGIKIPASKLASAAKKGGKLGRRARLAQTLATFKHTKKVMKCHKCGAVIK